MQMTDRAQRRCEVERERIYSKPMVRLTKAEFAKLDPNDQRRVMAFLARPPPHPWPYDTKPKKPVEKGPAS